MSPVTFEYSKRAFAVDSKLTFGCRCDRPRTGKPRSDPFCCQVNQISHQKLRERITRRNNGQDIGISNILKSILVLAVLLFENKHYSFVIGTLAQNISTDPKRAKLTIDAKSIIFEHSSFFRLLK